ncbi:LarC family nickel insertion protein [Thalassotalea sp. PLHSN55]|uniref:LarC family nickel insertion protein n=1 Tax=Thalassotalea sp. PLHSN55 TaxID=3435888 RepID=UPI003F857F9D
MNTTLKQSHIHLDIVGGIAGDMFVSAMLNAFESLQPSVLSAIAQVLPEHAGQAKISAGLNSGISGLRFTLIPANGATSKDDHSHHHSHQHHHAHDHSHDHDHSHVHHHDHNDETTYRHLCQLLKQSPLPEQITKIAVELLTIIAIAEAKIHNKTLDDVHFHELADWDSLMDVVAAAVILDALSASFWSISKLPLGSGLVNTQHGLIPVPAPATAEILLGFEFFNDNIPGERITPTGAAILKYLKQNDLLREQPQATLVTTGYGLGSKTFHGMPNILRALHFDKQYAGQDSHAAVVVIEFDVDDMTGEELALSLDILRAKTGVIDVTVQTARSKKNRATEAVRLLAGTDNYQSVIDECFNQTTTIGLRYRFETRKFLAREHHQISSKNVKSVKRPNGEITDKIEHDELTDVGSLQQRRALKQQVEFSGKEGAK